MANPALSLNPSQPRAFTHQLARWVFVVTVPVLMCLIAVRAVMTPAFLVIEYNRPGFPADPFGLTTEQRLQFAPFALDYLIYGQPRSALGNLTFDDGTLLYNENELVHMVDVQTVTQAAFALAVGLALANGLIAVYLALRDRPLLYAALNGASVATVAIIGAVVVFSLAAWDRFFVLFHEMFFADGTWVFPYSDTLIRLFPEQFWFDAALIIGGLTLAQAALLFGLSRFLPQFRGRRVKSP